MVASNSNSSNTPNSQKNIRRLRILQKRGLFGELPNKIFCKRATEVNELKAAYQLVYRIFLEENFIVPNLSGMRVRTYEASPSTATFICKNDGYVIATFSAFLDTPALNLPADKTFGPELNALRDEGAILCELGNNAILPEYRGTSIITEHMRCIFAQAWLHDVTDFVCAISPPQIPFYSMLGFSQLGEIKSYSDVVYDPVAVMRYQNVPGIWEQPKDANDDIATFRHHFFAIENPYIPVVQLWDSMVDRLFSTPSKMAELFDDCLMDFEQMPVSDQKTIAASTGLPLGVAVGERDSRYEGML